MTREQLKERVRKLPMQPGVYYTITSRPSVAQLFVE